jgi:hypothetical protein
MEVETGGVGMAAVMAVAMEAAEMVGTARVEATAATTTATAVVATTEMTKGATKEAKRVAVSRRTR